jgi:acetylxylan esterase
MYKRDGHGVGQTKACCDIHNHQAQASPAIMMLPRVFSYFLAVCQGVALAAELVPRATFSQVTNFGANPTNTRMFLFVPQNLAPKPAIVVGLHWCTGSAQAYYQGSNWARLSETYGYIVIYPSTPYLDSNCWDVASQKALTRGGGGNTDSIANMVKHVTEQYGADASRVYVTGISSGAMMTVGIPQLKL